MPTRTTIIESLLSRSPELRARGVAHIALYGSRMRSEERDDSDLDALIDVDPAHEPMSLIGLAGICRLLQEITGVETTAIERNVLARHPAFATRINDDIVEVF